MSVKVYQAVGGLSFCYTLMYKMQPHVQHNISRAMHHEDYRKI